jgi:hypothetical protein
MPDHPMKRKAIENAKRARELRDVGDALGRQVLILLLKGEGNLELTLAYEAWRDVSIGKPNFHPHEKSTNKPNDVRPQNATALPGTPSDPRRRQS